MTIRLQFFAIVREAAGAGECSVELGSGETVLHLLNLLCARYPGIAPYRPYLRVAVNRTYATLDYVLSEGDEVAIIPPMSGG
jgi:molybdopterin converting factor subunit 1